MLIKVKSDWLQDAIRRLAPMIRTGHTTHGYAGLIRFEAAEDRVIASVANGHEYAGIECTDAALVSTGDVGVDLALLSKLKLPKQPVWIELMLKTTTANKWLLVRGLGGDVKFIAHVNEEYPVKSAGIPLSEHTIDSEALEAALDATSYAMGGNDRPHLRSVNISGLSDWPRAVSTNGHRMAVADIQIAGDDEVGDHTVIPAETVSRLVSVLPDESQELRVELHNTAISVKGDDFEFHGEIMATPYPDWRGVLKSRDDYSNKLTFDREEMLSKLKIARLFTGPKSRGCKLEFDADEGTAELLASDPSMGEFSAGIPAKLEMANATEHVALNVDYLTDVVERMPKGGEVTMLFDGMLSPALFWTPGIKEEHVIMPIREDKV